LFTRSRAGFDAEREFYKKMQSIGNNRGAYLMFVEHSPVALFGEGLSDVASASRLAARAAETTA